MGVFHSKRIPMFVFPMFAKVLSVPVNYEYCNFTGLV